MTERLRVNPLTCDAHGLCAEILPELIRLDEWGYPVIEPGHVPEELLPLARRAVSACPTLALLLEKAENPRACAERGALPARRPRRRGGPATS